MHRKLLVPISTFLLSASIGLEAIQEHIGTHWGITEGLFPSLILWLGTMAVYMGIHYFINDTTKALALTLFGVYVTFNYIVILKHMNALEALAVFSITIMACFILVLWSGNVAKISIQTMEWVFFLNCLFLLVPIMRDGIIQRYDLDALPKKEDFLKNPLSSIDRNNLPDIYFIVLDAYASNDTLKRDFGYDNQEFHNFMKKNGFYIAEKSKSYYSQTMLSISSTLNMNYFQEDVQVPHTKYKDRAPAINYFLRPRLIEYLSHLGYNFIKLTSAYNIDFTFDEAEDDIRSDTLMVNMVDSLIYRTPIYHVLSILFGKELNFLNPYKKHYQTIINQHKSLRNIMTDDVKQKPKFVYAHFIQPHPPFVFDEKGSFASYPNLRPFVYNDGKYDAYNHLYPGGWNNFYRSAYIKQLRYLNQEIEKSIRTALAKNNNRPKIIIIQGDHGSRMKMDFYNVNNTDFHESFGIFNAVYFSDGEYSSFTQDISPANVMRMVMNKYFGFNLKKLENHQWYAPWNKPYAFIEVTKMLQ
jgi:hypothetical protein